MNDNELFEQARKRVQKKTKGRCVRNKDVIVEQEKEIQYYREKIQIMTSESKYKNKRFNNKFNVTINDETYVVEYDDNVKQIELNAYLIKMINEGCRIIKKENEFRIENVTAIRKQDELERSIMNCFK